MHWIQTLTHDNYLGVKPALSALPGLGPPLLPIGVEVALAGVVDGVKGSTSSPGSVASLKKLVLLSKLSNLLPDLEVDFCGVEVRDCGVLTGSGSPSKSKGSSSSNKLSAGFLDWGVRLGVSILTGCFTGSGFLKRSFFSGVFLARGVLAGVG